MTRQIVGEILLITVMFGGKAMAAEKFPTNAKVKIVNLGNPPGQDDYTLEKTGEEANGDGIYYLQTRYNNYLWDVKGGAGTMVGWTNTGDGTKGSQWVLHKNSDGWSIMAKKNGANTVTKVAKTAQSSGLELQRNQGSKNTTGVQIWQIQCSANCK